MYMLFYFIKHPLLFYQHLFHHFKALTKVDQNRNDVTSTSYKFINFKLHSFSIFLHTVEFLSINFFHIYVQGLEKIMETIKIFV